MEDETRIDFCDIEPTDYDGQPLRAKLVHPDGRTEIRDGLISISGPFDNNRRTVDLVFNLYQTATQEIRSIHFHLTAAMFRKLKRQDKGIFEFPEPLHILRKQT